MSFMIFTFKVNKLNVESVILYHIVWILLLDIAAVVIILFMAPKSTRFAIVWCLFVNDCQDDDDDTACNCSDDSLRYKITDFRTNVFFRFCI